MTKSERTGALYTRLGNMGFSVAEIGQLLKIERTLHRWAQQECGDGNDFASWSIERDEETGKPFRCVYPHNGKSYRTPIADRERGALKRLGGIMASHPQLVTYHQTDPRGCALYILRESDLGECPIEQVYNRGVAVCI